MCSKATITFNVWYVAQDSGGDLQKIQLSLSAEVYTYLPLDKGEIWLLELLPTSDPSSLPGLKIIGGENSVPWQNPLDLTDYIGLPWKCPERRLLVSVSTS